MDQKIIDFSNGDSSDSPVMIQPNFQIRNETISVSFKTPKGIPTFHIHGGCQGINMNENTLKNAIQEINGIPYEPTSTKVVVLKGASAKTSSPRLLELAGTWFITKDNKALSRDTHEIKLIDIKQKRKYFSPNTGWDIKDYPLQYRGGYGLSHIDIEKVKAMLAKIEKYFEEIKS